MKNNVKGVKIVNIIMMLINDCNGMRMLQIINRTH